MSGLARLGELWGTIQKWLFPLLEDELGALDDKHKEFIAVCEACAPRAHMRPYRWIGNGCPPKSRLALFKAFVAKAVWDFPTTRKLIDAIRHRPTLRRLCGWETLGEVRTVRILICGANPASGGDFATLCGSVYPRVTRENPMETVATPYSNTCDYPSWMCPFDTPGR